MHLLVVGVFQQSVMKRASKPIERFLTVGGTTVTACVDASTTTPTEGQNTVPISHDNVFDTDGQGFELVANLNPDEWAALQ